jgi:hypothetical protein
MRDHGKGWIFDDNSQRLGPSVWRLEPAESFPNSSCPSLPSVQNPTSSAKSASEDTARGRAILSVCGSASSTSWAPCERPGKHASMLIPPVPPVLLVDPNSCFILDCFSCGSKETSTRRTGGAGGQITIGREQSASPSPLAVVGLKWSSRPSRQNVPTARRHSSDPQGSQPETRDELC